MKNLLSGYFQTSQISQTLPTPTTASTSSNQRNNVDERKFKGNVTTTLKVLNHIIKQENPDRINSDYLAAIQQGEVYGRITNIETLRTRMNLEIQDDTDKIKFVIPIDAESTQQNECFRLNQYVRVSFVITYPKKVPTITVKKIQRIENPNVISEMKSEVMKQFNYITVGSPYALSGNSIIERNKTASPACENQVLVPNDTQTPQSSTLPVALNGKEVVLQSVRVLANTTNNGYVPQTKIEEIHHDTMSQTIVQMALNQLVNEGKVHRNMNGEYTPL